jgi:hypothetical protein
MGSKGAALSSNLMFTLDEEDDETEYGDSFKTYNHVNSKLSHI